MKKITLILLGATAAVLAGCIVTSVCPFYTEKDLVSEPALIGDWLKDGKSGGNEIWKFDPGEGLGYRFTLIEGQEARVMEAHAFKLQGQLFLEIASIDQDYHVIPAHYLLKVSQLTPTLRMSALNPDWLKALLAKEPGAIRHHLVKTGDKPDDVRIVLTADTPELQQFVLKYLKLPDAWQEGLELAKQKSDDVAPSKKHD
jgi:hypothetical protein